jgi:hypothetical protein
MADDTIPQNDPRKLTDDEIAARACDWSDYRKDYGISSDPAVSTREHKAFKYGWQVAHVTRRTPEVGGDTTEPPRYTMTEALTLIADKLEEQGIYSAVAYIRDNLAALTPKEG